MKKNIFKKLIALPILAAMTVVLQTGCGNSGTDTTQSNALASTPSTSYVTSADVSSTQEEVLSSSSQTNNLANQLYVTFGDSGSSFTMNLYDNETASAIARHVGSADWRLPIYNYDGYDNWEVMQYYDIPSRYEIPSKPENITVENIGEVYYSEPNRIVLFYGDAEVSGEYTPVGFFEPTEEFVNAVRDNTVLEGWGNKIIQICAQE